MKQKHKYECGNCRCSGNYSTCASFMAHAVRDFPNSKPEYFEGLGRPTPLHPLYQLWCTANGRKT